MGVVNIRIVEVGGCGRSVVGLFLFGIFFGEDGAWEVALVEVLLHSGVCAAAKQKLDHVGECVFLWIAMDEWSERRGHTRGCVRERTQKFFVEHQALLLWIVCDHLGYIELSNVFEGGFDVESLENVDGVGLEQCGKLICKDPIGICAAALGLHTR